MKKSQIKRPSNAEDALINAGIAADPDTFELTDEDFAKMRPAKEVLYELLPKETADAMLQQPKKPGRPKGSGTKKSITVRLDTDVLATFKKTGKGWQTRMNDALKDWLKENRP
jgi:uncharacterized protein (DUF4415 family)